MLELYSQLLSHLNAEENDMALEFEAKLIELLSQQDQLNEDSQFLQCLENAGVDNWGGYYDAREMMWPEDDDE